VLDRVRSESELDQLRPCDYTVLPGSVVRRRDGIRVHRRRAASFADHETRHGIPVTNITLTLVDLAKTLPSGELEAAVNEAVRLDLIDPDGLRSALAGFRGQRGAPLLRNLLERDAFRLTDSELERRFLRLIRAAGLPVPETGTHVNGYKVDFYWRDLELVVETDGLRFHRTAASQRKDRVRDQAHAAAGTTQLRFAHAQVRYEPQQVISTLTRVIRRLQGDSVNG